MSFIYIAEKEVLTEDDLIDVINALEENFSSSDWYLLGLQLRIKNNDLKTIECDYRDNSYRCLVECLIKWLITGKATYTGLVEALRKMGQNATADYFISKCVCLYFHYVCYPGILI